MLFNLLPEQYQRELTDIRLSAENILAHPLDPRFTDHTIEHKNRILNYLDTLLKEWTAREFEKNECRAQAELFVLIAATYLHDRMEP